jgi:hypothetical protein
MNRLHSTMSGILAVGFFGFLSFGRQSRFPASRYWRR